MSRPGLLAAAVLLLAAPAAQAHLMPPGHGALRVDGDEVFLLFAVPVSALSGFDDDGDGRLTVAELNAHRPVVTAQLAAGLEVASGEDGGRTLFEDLLIPHEDDGSAPPATHLVVMRHVKWSTRVGVLTLRAGFLRRATAGEATLAVDATGPVARQAAVLDATTTEHRFFDTPAPPPTERVAPALLLAAVLLAVALVGLVPVFRKPRVDPNPP